MLRLRSLELWGCKTLSEHLGKPRDGQPEAIESCYTVGMISDEYIAGFIDGEGYLGIMKHTNEKSKHGYNYVPTIKVCQSAKDRVVIDLLAERFGHKVGKPRVHEGNRQDSVTVAMNSRIKVKIVLDIVEPHLIIKKEQAKVLREFIATLYKQPWNKKENIDHNEEMLKKRHELYKRIRRLNQRGRRD